MLLTSASPRCSQPIPSDLVWLSTFPYFITRFSTVPTRLVILPNKLLMMLLLSLTHLMRIATRIVRSLCSFYGIILLFGQVMLPEMARMETLLRLHDFPKCRSILSCDLLVG